MTLWLLALSSAGIAFILARDAWRRAPNPWSSASSGTPSPTLRGSGLLDLCVVVVAVDARAARFFETSAASGEWSRELDAIRSARAGWIAAAVRDTVPTDLELAHASFARVVDDYRARARGTRDESREAGYRDVIVERERDVVVVAWVVVLDREVPDAPPEPALRSVDVLEALERLKTLGRLNMIHHRMVVAPSRGRLRESRLATLYPELATLTDPGNPVFCERCACPYEGMQCPHCGLRST